MIYQCFLIWNSDFLFLNIDFFFVEVELTHMFDEKNMKTR